jgi:hypothetical protein
MSTKVSLWTVLGWVVAIVIAFLYFRSCKATTAQLKLTQDSLNVHIRVTDSISKKADTLVRAKDSVIQKSHKDSTTFIRVADSLKTVINVLKGRFSVTKDSIGVLYRQLGEFYRAGDTAALKTAYIDLKQQLDLAGDQLKVLQSGRDSLDAVKSAEIDRLNGVVNTLNPQLDSAFSLLSTQIANSKAEESATQKLINTQKKAKFIHILEIIGVGIAGLFVGGKL